MGSILDELLDRQDAPIAAPKPAPAPAPAPTHRAAPIVLPAGRTGIKYYPDLVQGSDEWLQARCGLLTASEMKLVVKKRTDRKTGVVTWSAPDDDKERAHLYELLAQRITGYVEPHYIGDDMLRGHEDEVWARHEYNEKYAPVTEVGFITNDKWGFTIGYSPDALVGDDGLIECKSRRQKFQIETLINKTVPDEYMLQIQTGLLVSERQWIDFVSYSGGMHMLTIRVYPDATIQAAILEAAAAFEKTLAEKMAIYRAVLTSGARLIPTERRVEKEMHL